MWKQLCAILFVTCLSVGFCSCGLGQNIYLSDYLGRGSGGATVNSNPPFTIVLIPAEFGGFGVDTAGIFNQGQLIRFGNGQLFAKGVGAHPVSSIEFNLDEFRKIAPVDNFVATVGVDINDGGGTFGAVFTVTLDGVVVEEVTIANGSASPVSIECRVSDASSMVLDTAYFTNAQGNHACWADAHFSNGTVILGDINGDETTNLLDVDPFIRLLSLGAFQEEADTDFDGSISLLDVVGFIEALSN